MFYVQVPDSGPVGVLSAVADQMDTFEIPATEFPRPRTLQELARLVGSLARAGYAVALDEFQYFNRERLRGFCSLLQAEVDQLSAQASRIPGGLLVLGSIHTEMAALLQERHAPLYNRTTDELELGHLEQAAFRQLELVVRQADEKLAEVEGPALEKLVATLYEERSRKGIGDFRLTERIQGY